MKRHKRKVEIFVSILLSIMTLMMLNTPVQAYNTNNYAFPNALRGSLRYYIYNDASGIYNIGYHTQRWNGYSGIYLSSTSSPSSAHIIFDITNSDSGNFGVTYCNSNTSKTVIFYRAFINATSSQRNETIVHEVGHTLGLAHTQPQNNLNAVMRATGFNNKAYPLTDDIAGLRSLYN